MKKMILKRMREPSTWAGLAVLGTIFGMPPGSVELATQVVTGGAGLAAIFLGEGAGGDS